MEQSEFFSILDSAESTNNYAMAKVHAGLAKHGQAWFANEQWGGKGQRGKEWQTEKGMNIILSIAVKPSTHFIAKPFLLNMLTGLICRSFFTEYTGTQTNIKWPNDILFDDKKAGGILIENNFNGKDWKWAIIGIGININQEKFPENAGNPISLKNITSLSYNPIELAMKLHKRIMAGIDDFTGLDAEKLVNEYNLYLYKKNSSAKLKKGNALFSTTILGVNEFGQLITKDVIDRTFEHGDIIWVK